MSLYYGNTKIGSLYLGSDKIKEAYYGNVKVFGSSDPYNPYNLPPYTMRCAFTRGYTPEIEDATVTLVDETDNVWDITRESWADLFYGNEGKTYLEVVYGANATGITDMSGTFGECINLRYLPESIDTRYVTSFSELCINCTSLQSIPDWTVGSAEDVNRMFGGCYYVTTGITAMYEKLSTNGKVQYHSQTFSHCGEYTTSGAAELAQIPDDWK